jgi:hypothetical protein
LSMVSCIALQIWVKNLVYLLNFLMQALFNFADIQAVNLGR